MDTTVESCLSLKTYRVDDIPLLIAVIREMKLDSILDGIITTHGNTLNQNELTNGEAICIWLVYFLCAGTHRKWKVEHWVAHHAELLSKLWGAKVVGSDFTDDRLSTLAGYQARASLQEAIDVKLSSVTINIFELSETHIRLDATVLTGYHKVSEDGIMQYGHGKGGPDGCTQCKLMAASTATGEYITGQYHPGNRADDPLYVPLLSRLFRWGFPDGMLFVADSKMGALATRRHIIRHHHHYYMPLSDTMTPKKERRQWIEEAVNGTMERFTKFSPVFRDDELLGYGYEFTRDYFFADVAWTERVQVVRSLAMAKAGQETLERHLEKARAAIFDLTPAPKQGVKQYPDEESLNQAIANLMRKYDVEGLLHVTVERDATYRAPKAPNGRMVVGKILLDHQAYRARLKRCGWRIYVTSAPRERLGLDEGQLMYRQGAGQGVERMNRLLKDHDTLGLNRLYVFNKTQITGISYFVTLAQRIVMYIETAIRDALAKAREELPDYYPGHKSSAKPTTKTMLEQIIAHGGVTLTEIRTNDGRLIRHLSELPVILVHMLKHMNLPDNLYECLLE